MPKRASSDTIPALLTPGEAVLTKAAAEKLGRKTITKLNRDTAPKTKSAMVKSKVPGRNSGITYQTPLQPNGLPPGYTPPQAGQPLNQMQSAAATQLGLTPAQAGAPAAAPVASSTPTQSMTGDPVGGSSTGGVYDPYGTAGGSSYFLAKGMTKVPSKPKVAAKVEVKVAPLSKSQEKRVDRAIAKMYRR